MWGLNPVLANAAVAFCGRSVLLSGLGAASAIKLQATRRQLHKASKRLLTPTPPDFGPLAAYLGVATDSLVPGRVLELSAPQLKGLLLSSDDKLIKSLYAFADAFTVSVFGSKVYSRAIVEFSNVCTKDCFYCGIRKHMKVHRYTMTKDEILECADFAYQQGMGTLMLQSGEVPTAQRIDFMLDVVRSIRRRSVEREVGHKVADVDLATAYRRKGLAVALSLGELPSDVYQQFYDAGAHRYLLRIETSDPELYSKLHPLSHSFEQRLNCLKELKRIGFQLGTGVMVGVPHQNVDHMVGDLQFFKKIQPDMIGMGPYIVQDDTPLGKVWRDARGHYSDKDYMQEQKELFDLTTRMYSLARVTLGDVNIAATTALQVLDPSGREFALQRGANVVMPIITPLKFREKYQLYTDKPCIDEDGIKCTGCLQTRVRLAGKQLLLDKGWHDPPHYLSRRGEQEKSA